MVTSVSNKNADLTGFQQVMISACRRKLHFAAHNKRHIQDLVQWMIRKRSTSAVSSGSDMCNGPAFDCHVLPEILCAACAGLHCIAACRCASALHLSMNRPHSHQGPGVTVICNRISVVSVYRQCQYCGHCDYHSTRCRAGVTACITTESQNKSTGSR